MVNLRYLACVLRVADILEFDPERTPDIIYRHRNISRDSRIFWWQSFYIIRVCLLKKQLRSDVCAPYLAHFGRARGGHNGHLPLPMSSAAEPKLWLRLSADILHAAPVPLAAPYMENRARRGIYCRASVEIACSRGFDSFRAISPRWRLREHPDGLAAP